MSVLWIVLGLVALQRGVELWYAARNTRRLLARGGREVASHQYPFFILLHGAWLLALVTFVPRDASPNWWLLAVYALLQVARVWTVASLGPYWTTRIVTVPQAPLVRRGPYRLLRHPNYAIVALEVAILPLAFHAYAIAIVFTVLDAALLAWRIRIENGALQSRRTLAPTHADRPV